MKKAKVDWKSLSRKERIGYIWDYYKIHVIVGILALCVGISTIITIVNHRDPLMGVIMLNCEKQTVESQPVFEDFLTAYDYEVYEQAVRCHTNFRFWEQSESQDAVFSSTQYENAQLFQAYFALLYTREYDVIMGNGSAFEQTLADGAFEDITQLLTEFDMALYDDYVVYCVNEETGESYPCAIRLSQENGWLQEHGLYKECAVGILKSAPHKEMAENLLRYLLVENLRMITEENP